MKDLRRKIRLLKWTQSGEMHFSKRSAFLYSKKYSFAGTRLSSLFRGAR